MESKGEASVGVEAEAVYRHCLQILTAETIKIWKFRTIHFLVLD